MDALGISDLAARPLHELSGGQRQRAFVAQGLAQEAGVLLPDEPVTGLDGLSRQRILEAIAAERAAGRAVVGPTHRSDGRRVGKRWRSTSRSQWVPGHKNKKQNKNII